MGSSVEKYEPSTKTTSTLAPMNTARYYHSSVVFENMVIVLGGAASEVPLASTEIYETGAWREVSSMKIARKSCAAVIVHNTICVVGGCDMSSGYNTNNMESYEIEFDQWTLITELKNMGGEPKLCPYMVWLAPGVLGEDVFKVSDEFTKKKEEEEGEIVDILAELRF